MYIVTGLPPQLWAEDNGSAIEELTQKVFLGKWEDVSIINAVKSKLQITDTIDNTDKEVCFAITHHSYICHGFANYKF